ncbi:hypothetical protein JF66_18820 [Cryobacterium sp. MLB-32]|uniref:hypothetical protein n=1 Tax=Cryobacterium sp. MLB-32 TaxID=1529318 RepID=UPI0004E66B1F|nr:hypothetical protein [Cryobacterium sp. MLB-32]KFF58403.1 hypothetical protein JF66_18820 [Cryobacterium sp. MLB-32]
MVSLLDEDSTALGRLVAQEILKTALDDNLYEQGATWREWRNFGADRLTDVAHGGTVWVCAAVVGSGRQLTAVSRQFRKVPGESSTLYQVA